MKLLKPSLKNNTNAKLNKSNNIEFNLILAPSKTEELVIKYIIEHHADLEIDFFWVFFSKLESFFIFKVYSISRIKSLFGIKLYFYF